MFNKCQYYGCFGQLLKRIRNHAAMMEYVRSVWILAAMLFVGLHAAGQRADMGFFNRIKLHTDIKRAFHNDC